jgi:hypothetical protein
MSEYVASVRWYIAIGDHVIPWPWDSFDSAKSWATAIALGNSPYGDVTEEVKVIPEALVPKPGLANILA